MLPDRNAPTGRHTTYLTLTGLFLTLFAAFTLRQRRKGTHLELRPFDLVLLGCATYRLGRLAAYDKVTQPLRQPVAETQPDSSGAGQTVVPRGSGVRRALGELIACPICIGTWIAAGLVYGLGGAPHVTRAFMAIMSAAGVAELLNAATEALQWSGRAAREETGTFSEARRRT